jgi:hypothetical protein
MRKQRLDVVEGSTPSETEEEPSNVSVRVAKKCGHSPLGIILPCCLEEKNLWMMVRTWTNWNLIRELLGMSRP